MNGGGADSPATGSLAEWALRQPDAVAIDWVDLPGRPAWTWAVFAGRVAAVARRLADAGLRPGDRLAVVGGNAPAWVLLREAAEWLGLVFVPVGPKLAPPERDWLLRDAAPARILGAAGLPAGAIGFETWDWVGSEPPLAAAAWPAPAKPPAGIGQLLYTSGSGGRPKGVLRPAAADHDRIVRSVAAFGLRTADRHLVAGPLVHSGPSIFYRIFRAIGARQAILQRFDAGGVVQRLADGEVDALFMVPTMWRMLLEIVGPQPLSARLRIAWSAGSALDPATRHALLDWLGDEVLWEFYGATETGTISLLPPARQRSHAHTVGFPARGVEVEIRDAAGKPLPAGRSGQIWVRSPGVMAGFHGAAAAETDAAMDGAGWVTVGDLGERTDDGAIVLHGRSGGMLISGGINMYPEEIEAELRALPGVREAVVFGQADPRWGQVVCAWVEPQADALLQPEILEAALRSRLAGYKLPRRWRIGPLPRTPSQKVLRDPVRIAAAFAEPEAPVDDENGPTGVTGG